MAECKIKFVPTQSKITGKTVRRLEGDMGTLTDTIFKSARQRAFTYMRCAWTTAAEIAAYAKYPFENVTGNLFESIGFALIGKSIKTGNLFVLPSFPASKAGFSSTRPALGKGETYDLPQYADGKSVASIGKPYIGETNRGKGLRGKDTRWDYVEKIKNTHAPSKTHLYNIVAFAAMPYASYVNMKRGREFFQSVIMDCLKEGIFEANLESQD